MNGGREHLPRRRVDGLLLLDKAAGPTSNAALQAARRLYRAAKAGHTGTLDPLATGLLPVLFGEATKFGGELLDADKTYAAGIALGSTTTTGDAEGEVVERRPVTATRTEVEQVLAGFRGEGAQVPPMYSALKRDGRPLYEYARAGQSVERAARPISDSRARARRARGREPVGHRPLQQGDVHPRARGGHRADAGVWRPPRAAPAARDRPVLACQRDDD